jgi:aerobic C4-dicarboxylate transport protein
MVRAMASAAPSKPSSKLYVVVLISIALGVLVGALAPKFGEQLKPLGDGFVKLIKMLIAPLVFCTVATGIAGMGDLKRVGRVGLKALLWFEGMTTLALVLGLAMVNVVKPGSGLHQKLEALDTAALDKTLSANRPHGVVEHLLALLPDSFVGAFTSGDVLQVLVLAVLTGIALAGLQERGAVILKGLEAASQLLFALVGVVMWLSPIGAFGAMAYTISKQGLAALGSLALLMGSFYATALLFVFGVLGLVLALGLRLSIFKLVRYLKEELLVVLATSSSESALPMLMAKLEAAGCAGPVVRLVVPTGYSFNLDGTCIYLTMASMFVAQALDVPMSLGQQLGLLGVLLLTSKGAAGVTGSGFVTLAATLSSVGTVPVGGISLLLGIDRFMSEARALTNLMGNAVATLVVSRWEGKLDAAAVQPLLGLGVARAAAGSAAAP